MTTFSIGLSAQQLDAIIKWVKTIKPNRTRGEYITVQPLEGALKFTCADGQVEISKLIGYNYYPDHICVGKEAYSLPTQEFIKAVDSVKAQWKSAQKNVHNFVTINWVNKAGAAPITVSTEQYFQNQIEYFKFEIYHNASDEIGVCSKNELPCYLYSNKFFIDAGELQDLLKRALPFINPKDPRQFLNGVYFNYSDKGFSIASTDGRHVFTQQRIPLKISEEDSNRLVGSEGIIPAKAVGVLIRQLYILLKNKKHAATRPEISVELSTNRAFKSLTNKYGLKDFSGENITFNFQGMFGETKFTIGAQLIPDQVYPRISEFVPHHWDLEYGDNHVGFYINEQCLDLIKRGIYNGDSVKLTLDLEASNISLNTENGIEDCFVTLLNEVTGVNKQVDFCFNSKLLENTINGIRAKTFDAYIHKDAFNCDESYSRINQALPLILTNERGFGHIGTTCVVMPQLCKGTH
jgi:hypothetical protein